jgi:hypothetical protein
MSIKAYTYRISSNKTTTEKLDGVITLCRQLYNAALHERRDAYEMMVKRHPNYYDGRNARQEECDAQDSHAPSGSLHSE